MKGMRFNHPMASQFKDAITDEESLALVPAIVNGDRDAINIMIEGHLKYACAIVSRYLMSMNSNDLADELTEAAFYGVVDGVNAITRNGLNHNNPTGYIARYIHGEIRSALKHMKSVIYTPRDIDVIRAGHLSSDTREEQAESPADNSLEVEEDITVIINDKTDECIVRLLRQGESPAKISRLLNLAKSTVSRRISRIQTAYQELQNE